MQLDIHNHPARLLRPHTSKIKETAILSSSTKALPHCVRLGAFYSLAMTKDFRSLSFADILRGEASANTLASLRSAKDSLFPRYDQGFPLTIVRGHPQGGEASANTLASLRSASMFYYAAYKCKHLTQHNKTPRSLCEQGVGWSG